MGLGRTVVAASSVVVVAGLLLVQLDVAERLASSRELQLSRVAGLVESLASQQWEALAVGREDQQALADFRRTWAQANSQLAQFRVLAPTDSRLSEVVLWFESFVSDLDQELTFIKSGSMADAADFERSSVLHNASANSVVDAVPPRSRVRAVPAVSTAPSASMMRSAADGSSM